MEIRSGNESGTRQLLRRFFTYYQPHRTLFALDFSCAVLSGVLELGFPMAVGLFIDRLLPGQDWGLILVAAAALLAVYLLNTGLMVVVNYWGHMLGINIETEMRRKSFDHLQKLSFRFYDNQKTGHLVARVTKDLEEIGEVAHHGPEDLFVAVMTFVGAFVLMFVGQPQARPHHRLDRPGHRVDHRPLRRAHDPHLAGALRPRRRVQRAHRGERRRHARGAGLRQRGPRASPLRRRQRPLPRHQAGGLPHHGRQHVAELPQHALHPAGGDDRGHLLRAPRRAERGRVRQLPPPRRRLLPPGGKDQRRPGDLPQRDRRVQALHRAARHRAGHRRRAGRDRGLGLARRHSLRERDLRLRPGADGAARYRPRHPRRRDGRLRRPLRRRQDDDLLAAAALLRDRRRADHHRRHRYPRHDAGLAATRDRHRAAGRLPLRRHHPREHRLRPARRHRRRDRGGGAARASWTRSSPGCRTGWTRSSASAA